MAKGLEIEHSNFGKLTQTTESEALMACFTAPASRRTHGKPKSPAQTVGVLGAGLRVQASRSICLERAQRAAKDINAGAVARGIGQIEGNLNQSQGRRMTVFQRDETLSRVTGLDNDGNWKQHFANWILSSRRCSRDGYQAQGCERI